MEDRRGVPPISRITWFWALILTFCSSGIFALVLGLNLSLWVRKRRRSGVALFGYLLVVFLWVPEAIFFRFFSVRGLGENLFTIGASVWVVSTFALRREFQLYYARPDGSLPPVNPWWTGIFSIYYLNYWLWVLRDSL
jgi:hypothetical protein